VHQQDNPIQINQWVFLFSQSSLIKADSDQFINDSLESVELNNVTRDILWQMISSYPEVISADKLISTLNDDTINRNKLYQTIAKLRRIFDDKSHDASYIETVPRKGYRWLVEPVERKTLSPKEDTESQSHQGENIESEVHSGVLEQNIFDDLGFISDESTEQHKPQDISPNDDNESDQEETKPPSLSDDLDTKVKHKTTGKKLPWFKIMAAVALCIIIVTLAYRALRPTDNTVFIPSDVLYVSPLELEADSKISPLTLERVQWWVDQKLQHLPAVKVMPYLNDNATPRLSGGVESVESGFKINLTITPKLKTANIGQLDLFLSNSLSQNLVQNNAFNQSITSLITGTKANTLVNDQCDVSSFSLPISTSTTPKCLVTLNLHYQQLLEKLALVVDDTENTVKQLEALANQTITLYSKQSLGYEMLASYFNIAGLFEQEHEQLLIAMALNQNAPSILKALSESYRRLRDFNRSLVLVEALLERGLYKEYAIYWKAYDLVALGFLEKAQVLIKDNDVELSTIEQQIYFFGVNYNQIKSHLNETETQTIASLDYIESLISDEVYCIEKYAMDVCIRQATNNVNSEYAIKQWQGAALYLKNGEPQQGHRLLSSEPWLEQHSISLAEGADRLFYLPTYANILIQTGQDKEAQALLKRFIVFIKSSGKHQLYALPLAEAYALSGQTNDALKQMAQLLASGWLPAEKYQVWPLKDNPNFQAINRQWQFLNLLELIENRRQLIRLRVQDLRKAQ